MNGLQNPPTLAECNTHAFFKLNFSQLFEALGGSHQLEGPTLRIASASNSLRCIRFALSGKHWDKELLDDCYIGFNPATVGTGESSGLQSELECHYKIFLCYITWYCSLCFCVTLCYCELRMKTIKTHSSGRCQIDCRAISAILL